MNPLIGKVRFQPFFSKLHAFALKGMNVGTGSTITQSGELSVIQRLRDSWNAREQVTLFDVGANKGDYALALLEAFQAHPNTLIYAFEPSNPVFAELQQALRSHPQGQRLQAFNIGLGEKNERRTLYSSGESGPSGLSSLYPRRLDHFNIPMKAREEIELQTLDDFCAAHSVASIQLLKLDVEGHELAVLQGAHRMIEGKAIEAIQFEFGGCDIDSRTFFQDYFYLLNPQYRLYRILIDGLAPIDAYQEEQEIFLTTNFLALRRS